MTNTETVGTALNFFASVIKSGEPWTATCQAEFDKAHTALASRTQSPAEWRTDVHDGAAACHVMAARWGEEGGEWIVDIVMAPPGKPWTHWRHLGPMPDAALRAASIPAPERSKEEVGVRVKPLEWNEDGDGHWKASALTGLYHVIRFVGGGEMYRLRLSWSLLVSDGDFPTLEEAKAAAQADYEQRILSALEPAPLPVTMDRADYRKVAEQAYWLLAWTWQSHLFRVGEPFDMTIFAPEARDMMNKGEQDLFDALSALSKPGEQG